LLIASVAKITKAVQPDSQMDGRTVVMAAETTQEEAEHGA
jgi:hypothetical protein